jgi:hypothetical protein
MPSLFPPMVNMSPWLTGMMTTMFMFSKLKLETSLAKIKVDKTESSTFVSLKDREIIVL